MNHRALRPRNQGSGGDPDQRGRRTWDVRLEMVTTRKVPPTRDARDRVYTGKSTDKKLSMFSNRSAGPPAREWRGEVRGSKLVVTAGVIGTELTETVEDHG